VQGQRQRNLLMVLLSVACVTLFGCGGGGADADALPWVFYKHLGPHKGKLAVEVGYCVGEPRPHVEKVTRRYSGNQVFLTLILEERPSDPERCLGKEIVVFRSVSFRRKLGQLELFDSSTDPPTRRWPL
jgi:hypothetical protein